jgi:hypothetical protein
MARTQLCSIGCLSLLFGCSTSSPGDAGVAGSLDGGGAFTVNFAGEDFAPQADGVTPDLSRVAIHLSFNQWSCLPDGGPSQGTYLRFEAATDGGGPLTPGTYPVSYFLLHGIDPTSQLPANYDGDGQVTLTAIDAQAATGSMSVQVTALGSLEGTFQAPFCTLRNPLH